MKTLEEYNRDRLKDFQTMYPSGPSPTNIECPDCKEELLYSEPNVVLASYPPKKRVHCPKCGFLGYVYA
jgi:ribosomal protein S27AE